MGRKSALFKQLTDEPTPGLLYYNKKEHCINILKVTDELTQSALKSHGKRRAGYVTQLRTAVMNLAATSLKHQTEKKYTDRLEKRMEKSPSADTSYLDGQIENLEGDVERLNDRNRAIQRKYEEERKRSDAILEDLCALQRKYTALARKVEKNAKISPKKV